MQALSLSYKRAAARKPLSCVAAFALTAVLALNDFLQWQSLQVLLGFMAFPFTVAQAKNKKFRYGWFIAAAGCALFCFAIPVKTALFFSVGFSGFALLAFFGKRATVASAAVLFLMAPVFQYFVNTFSFEVRLALARWVGHLFQIFKSNTSAQQAVIHHNGNAFSVDPACMGLNMLVASLLLAIIFLGYQQRNQAKRLASYFTLMFLAVVVLLNIGSNLIRIFLLVQFAIAPEAVLHEAIGLICLAVYVAVPAGFGAKWCVKIRGKPQPPAVVASTKTKSPLLILPLLALITAAGIFIGENDSYKRFEPFSHKRLDGYSVIQHVPGILKIENKNALVYIKYIRGFYDTDHNPAICWRGSGYTFQNVATQNINGTNFFTARLQNQTDTLYTAWCYSTGKRYVTSQMAWRKDMAWSGSTYAVINITAATEQALVHELKMLTANHPFAPLFQNPDNIK